MNCRNEDIQKCKLKDHKDKSNTVMIIEDRNVINKTAVLFKNAT